MARWAATVTPAEELNLDAKPSRPEKLAFIVIVDGDPLENIANTQGQK